MYQFSTSGVCARDIKFNIVNNKVVDVEFNGGCNGNLEGISRLIEGMDIEQVIEKLSGLRCGSKQTSCPDQLVKALETAIKKAAS
ncbi:MAG TPA: TIGR03905 family TSCPD domain-containing protein [Tissierellaceae bacterium]|nr:TIGR03905 family TSCPD domain-containing protein [Tissierellaceae bacterium]